MDRIKGVGVNVTVRGEGEGYCPDQCWEAVVEMGREEQVRRECL